VLWRPESRTWQYTLADVFLPAELRDRLRPESPGEVLLVVHPTLAHVPFEALHVDADRPLGVAAAVRRLPLLTPTAQRAGIERVAAFFDPALNWPAEQAVVGRGVPTAAEWLADLGTQTLGVFAAHGNVGLGGFNGWLTTTDRSQTVTAADLLVKRLEGSVVVFEACWAGRHVGHSAGETLNMTTAAFLAGAAGVIAGLWTLPADPECTGQITADCLAAVDAGVGPAEALRRARERFLAEQDTTICVPGRGGTRMDKAAPWAWAGLCAFG
jgi:CHAT domain